MADKQIQGITDDALGAGLSILMVIVAFISISIYNVIELNAIIFTTFKRRSGLYFWSFVVATWGIAPHTVGFVLKFFALTSTNYLPCALVALGWVPMVTGQSVVLYSRLHLVVQDARRIRWVLCMIIFNAIVFHIPVIILAFGVNSPNPLPFIGPFLIYDKVQIAVFFGQESIISIVYIYQTIQLLGSGGETTLNPIRQLLAHLILVNVTVLVFDITLLGVQYSGFYEIQTTLKAAVYSIKLKIEFSVLNRLVAVVQNNSLARGNINNPNGSILPDACGRMDIEATSLKNNLQPGSRMTEFITENNRLHESNDSCNLSLAHGRRQEEGRLVI